MAVKASCKCAKYHETALLQKESPARRRRPVPRHSFRVRLSNVSGNDCVADWCTAEDLRHEIKYMLQASGNSDLFCVNAAHT